MQNIFRPTAIAVLLTLLFLCSCNRAAADNRENSCIDCHSDTKFLVQNKKLYDYFQKWAQSDHFRNGVKCQDCHGGNPDKRSKEEAHGSIGAREASDPKSEINFKNIPDTCKRCHQEIYDAYKTSHHFEKLKGKGNGANCVTCHGSVSVGVLTTNTVKETCKQCHNKETKNAPEVPGEAVTILNKYMTCNRLYRWILKHDKPGAESVSGELGKRVAGLVREWHTFDIDEVRKNVEKLLIDLKRAQVALGYDKPDIDEN